MEELISHFSLSLLWEKEHFILPLNSFDSIDYFDSLDRFKHHCSCYYYSNYYSDNFYHKCFLVSFQHCCCCCCCCCCCYYCYFCCYSIHYLYYLGYFSKNCCCLYRYPCWHSPWIYCLVSAVTMKMKVWYLYCFGDSMPWMAVCNWLCFLNKIAMRECLDCCCCFNS